MKIMTFFALLVAFVVVVRSQDFDGDFGGFDGGGFDGDAGGFEGGDVGGFEGGDFGGEGGFDGDTSFAGSDSGFSEY